MVTKADLKVVDLYVEEVDNTTWVNVEYQGDRYILISSDVTDEVLDEMPDKDPYLSLLFALGSLPRFDNAVFRADKNWKIVGECGPECEKGICAKRIAQSRPEHPNVDQAFNLLIDYLNS